MPQYIEKPCPQCGKGLRIRTTYVGLRLACKYCNHNFLLQPDGQLVTAPAAPPAASPSSPSVDLAPELEAHRQRTAALEQDLDKVRAELAAAMTQREDLVLQLQKKHEELTREREQSQGALQVAQARQEAELTAATTQRVDLALQLQKKEEELARVQEESKDTLLQLAQARQEAVQATEQLREQEAARSESDGMQQQLKSLQEKVARAGTLEQELTSARAEIARLGAEREEIEAASRRRGEEAVNELAAARSECCLSNT